ncbi:MAG: transglutaminase family protein [Sphingomicrobium sp.]
MQLNVLHRTSYRFTQPLSNAIQLLRLTPTSCLAQSVLDWRIEVGCDSRLRETKDGYGNCVHMLYVDEPVTELVISATGRVITEDRAGVVEGLPNDLPSEVFLRPTVLTAPDEALRPLADSVRNTDDPLSLLHALNAAVHGQMTFDTAVTETATSAGESYQARRGVCQDFAHIFIAAARMSDIPARYVSGHLYRRDAKRSQEAGHAWAEAWVPALGWVAFDPTHGICADDNYIRVATGLDYGDAAPIAGTRRGGGAETMSVEVEVTQTAPRSQRASQRQSQRQNRQGQEQSQSQSRGPAAPEPPRRS